MKEYILAIVAVSLLTVLATAVLQHGLMRKAATFVAGLLLLLTVVRPLLHLDQIQVEDFFFAQTEGFSAQEAQTRYQAALAAHIRSTAEGYIRQRAEALGALVQVEVALSEDDPPVPWSVCVIGTLQAEQLGALKAYIQEAFAIPEDRQEWKLYG